MGIITLELHYILLNLKVIQTNSTDLHNPPLPDCELSLPLGEDVIDRLNIIQVTYLLVGLFEHGGLFGESALYEELTFIGVRSLGYSLFGYWLFYLLDLDEQLVNVYVSFVDEYVQVERPEEEYKSGVPANVEHAEDHDHDIGKGVYANEEGVLSVELDIE